MFHIEILEFCTSKLENKKIGLIKIKKRQQIMPMNLAKDLPNKGEKTITRKNKESKKLKSNR